MRAGTNSEGSGNSARRREQRPPCPASIHFVQGEPCTGFSERNRSYYQACPMTTACKPRYHCVEDPQDERETV